MAKRKRIKAPALPVPSTREEAEQMLRELGQVERDIASIEKSLNDQLEKIKAEHEAKAKPLAQRSADLFKALHAWAEANRDEITKHGKTKTVRMGAGVMLWRVTPPKVSLSGVESIIERITALGLGRFLRTKREINKEAMLAEPEIAKAIQGVKINQAEEFVIKPDDVEIERSETVKKAA